MSVSSAVQKTYFDNKVTAFAKHGVTTKLQYQRRRSPYRKTIWKLHHKCSSLSSDLILGIKLTIWKSHVYIIGCLFHSTNLSAEAYKSVLLEPFDLYDEICKTGPAIRCGNFNTDIINKDSSLQSKLLVDWVTERNMCNTFECDGVFSFFIIVFVIITVMSSIKR